MENKEFFAALSDLVKEKGISEEAFLQTLENALASAYKKQWTLKRAKLSLKLLVTSLRK